MKCPSCSAPIHQAGRTYKCERCDGAWIKAEVLVPLLEQSASTLLELPWQPNAEDHVRPCPECSTTMQTVKLGSVALDRCEPHGVWFDQRELAELIGQAKQFRAEREHRSLLDRLASLFNR